MTNYTPMMQQYITIKKEYEDAFLFFRLGDFYELFFDDAVRASSLLEITLTARDAAAGKEKIPMCGVPYHAASNYIETLVSKGYKVAICEQTEDPKFAKGIVKREVVKIVTPGTLTEGKTIDATANHYIGAVERIAHTGFAFAYVDVATGSGKAEMIRGTEDDVFRMMQALQMKELVISTTDEEIERLAHVRKVMISQPTTTIEVQPSLIESVPTGVQPVIQTLVSYVAETQKTSLDHLQPFEYIASESKLMIDAHSMRNLEVVQSIRQLSKEGTLYELLDETTTAMGSRKLKSWLFEPLRDEQAIHQRLDRVEALIESFFTREQLKQSLKQVYDLERLAGRISMGSASGRDLAQLRQSLQVIPTIIEQLNDSHSEVLMALSKQMNPCTPLVELLERAIAEHPPISVKEAGVIREGYDQQLDELRDASRNGKAWLSQLEQKERERTGIKNLKIGYNRVFGYFIEVTRAQSSQMDTTLYERKQTLANSERFITDELKEKEALILNADEQSLALEYERFVEIREQTKQYISEVQQMATQLSELDVYIALAIVAEQEQYVRPQFSKANELKIVEGRHPVVEKMMDRSLYVSNSCILTQEENMYLITGPNMSGKSTYMRQIALTVLMAQVGSFVPCEEAVLPLTDRIFTRIGAADDVASGQSTFMMEMMESQVALSQATSKSLLLFDEIGRGTSTYDGMSLAQAMMEFIHDEIGANTLFSTHYHELTALEQQLPRLKNVHVDAKEQNGDVVFLHKVKEGSQDKSYGIHVAKLADLPPTIIARASELLEQFEKKKKEEPVEVEKADQVQEQLSFFEQIQPQEHHPKTTSAIEDEIRALDLYNMTPMEALNQLAIWKKQATKG